MTEDRNKFLRKCHIDILSVSEGGEKYATGMTFWAENEAHAREQAQDAIKGIENESVGDVWVTDEMFTSEQPWLVEDPEYGSEVVVTTTGERQLRSDAGDVGDAWVGANYIRIIDTDGVEQGYWSQEEWRKAPSEVMGAIIGCLIGFGDMNTKGKT